MRLKSDNHARQVKRLLRSVRELDLDLKAIINEHDEYRLKCTNEEITDWFQSLPIETLKESCDREHGRPRTKYSLDHMRHKFALRRLYEKKLIELERKKSELIVANINHILAQIDKAL